MLYEVEAFKDGLVPTKLGASLKGLSADEVKLAVQMMFELAECDLIYVRALDGRFYHFSHSVYRSTTNVLNPYEFPLLLRI